MKTKWLISSALCVGMLGTQAVAQDAPVEESSAEADAVMQTIVVTGFREQTRNSINAKRDYQGVGDFLLQDDLGRVPDLNIAESLQRAPGVLTVFDEDEGRYVAVRGLSSDFTYIGVDGSQLAALDKTQRRIITEGIPPTAVKGLEVFKTLTPDMDANAIGGAVNLVTRSAYDVDDIYFVGTVQVGDHTAQYLPADDKLSYNLNATFSNQFGANDEFGFLLYGTWFEKTRDQTKNNRTNGIINDQPVTRTIIPLDYENTITRNSYGGKFEFNPDNGFYGYVQASDYNYEYDEFRYLYRLDGNNASLTQDGPSGTFGEARARAQTLWVPLTQDLTNYQAYAEQTWGEKGLFDFTASYSEAVWTEPVFLLNHDAGTSADFGYSYDFGAVDRAEELAPLSISNPGAANDLTRYNLQNYETDFVEMEEGVTEFKGNFAWNTESADEGWGFKTGLLWRELDRTYNRDRFRFNYNGTAPVTLDNWAFTNGHEPAGTPGVDMIFGDILGFRDFFAANQADFVDDGSSVSRSAQSDYSVLEEVLAGYGMVTYSGSNYRVVGGLRYEQTDVEATSFFNDNGTPTTSTRSTDYGDLLPSVLFTYDLREDLRFTAGYSQAIGRPNHPDLALAESRNVADDGSIRITRGNPDLTPRRSDNFDLALDWYWQEGGLISIAVFYKDIQDDIFRLTTDEVINGEAVEVSQPVNTSSSEVTGVEFTFIDDRLDFLPGVLADFGVSTNFTYLTGEIAIPNADGTIARVSENLQEQPEWVWNASLLYARGPFDARLSYSYRDDYYFRLRQNQAQDRIELAYEQWDFNARYRFTENISGSFEARNFGGETRRNSENFLVRGDNDFGESYWLGVTYSY